ncbi:MAG: lysylphosphatidylglycerol synthase transmembrane domain-containing protein [Prevotella sp.]|uniref:lysylphosphatidylglycerol synthase transmembrane domain-containing protein n=1 Tax=Prevotella sp. TaxID=59823 RepID=UPI002A28FF03|nr:lysylphosphatidylglycerol synthase transmembrane domain-containing protein [Prevotella sp.]MDD7319058.1 lysylphosphatidylglycerol synthase transmembrane domain-containing protein [Prevotellaceae bacterium]MDY4020286.1 lysylphosphatidylglycerol synthase transmembrane domain-containing protein [Prevotella sp.]
MEGQKKIISKAAKIAMPVILGAAILYWMYRDFDFSSIGDVMLHEMDWTWMILSMPFGILAQMFRGWRWKLSLEPLGDPPRTATCINSIFMSYAASLVVPRIGEFTRCGVLRRYDGVSFPKALGTVVTERAIDTLLVLAITALTLLWQMSIFGVFFEKTGTSIDSILSGFSLAGYLVTIICAIAAAILLHFLFRRLSIYNKVRSTLGGIWQGVMSLRGVRNKPLFTFYTLAIWGSYFIHYYLTFFCFEATSSLGISCALVTFIVGSIAVIVPTPNGAGPWHFAVKTMLILYFVPEPQALYFVLIVHTLQTMLVVLLGVYAWAAQSLCGKKEPERQQTDN